MIDLTPLDVRKKKGDFKRGLRGYDAAQVDDFLDIVADRMETLVREHSSFTERVARLEQQVAEYREREKALTEALVTAQEMREEMRAQVAREAELLRRQAEQEAGRIRADATQLREREEEMLRDLRSRQMQFVQTYRTFLERELADLQSIARGLEMTLGAPEPSGRPGTSRFDHGEWATTDSVEPPAPAAARAEPGRSSPGADVRPQPPGRPARGSSADDRPFVGPARPEPKYKTSGMGGRAAPPPAEPPAPPAAERGPVPPATGAQPGASAPAPPTSSASPSSAPQPPRTGERTAFAAGLAGAAVRPQPPPPTARTEPARREPDADQDEAWLAEFEEELILSEGDVLEESSAAADVGAGMDMMFGDDAPADGAAPRVQEAFGGEIAPPGETPAGATSPEMLDALLSAELGGLAKRPPRPGGEESGIGLDLVPEFESFSELGDLNEMGEIGTERSPPPAEGGEEGKTETSGRGPDDDSEDLLSTLFGDDR
jgi:DivIVA domain-containing protein